MAKDPNFYIRMQEAKKRKQRDTEFPTPPNTIAAKLDKALADIKSKWQPSEATDIKEKS